MENLLILLSGFHLISLNAYLSPKINARHGSDQANLQEETLPGEVVINVLAMVFKLAAMMEFRFLISDSPTLFWSLNILSTVNNCALALNMFSECHQTWSSVLALEGKGIQGHVFSFFNPELEDESEEKLRRREKWGVKCSSENYRESLHIFRQGTRGGKYVLSTSTNATNNTT